MFLAKNAHNELNGCLPIPPLALDSSSSTHDFLSLAGETYQLEKTAARPRGDIWRM
jgi:hypothetical protein